MKSKHFCFRLSASMVVLMPLFSRGQIEFAETTRISAHGVRAAQIGDIDLDGDIDFVVGNDNVLKDEGNNLVIYWNVDDSSYISQDIPSSESISSFVLFDQENDGDLDIIAADKNNDLIVWFENNGSGHYGPKQVISETSLTPYHVHSGDMDNDGDSDVLVVSYADNQVAWYENLSEGNFTSEQNIWSGMSFPYEVDAADVDGDGDLDILTACYTDDSISWFENYADGSYSNRNFVTTNCEKCKCVEVADLDGDGDMDFIAGSDGGDGVIWFENNGSNGFAISPEEIDPGRYAKDLLAKDLDGDGDIDVIAAGSGALSWYENDGEGTFSEIIVSETFSGYRSIVVGDTNGDGFDDLVGAGGNSMISGEYKLQTFLGDGNGIYTANPVISTSPRNVHQIWSEDFNQDNVNDVLVLSVDDGTLGFYEGIGEGEFYTEHIIPELEADGDALDPWDLDGDGDLDLVLSTGTEIIWRENNGNGEFAASVAITSLQNEFFDFCGIDFDNDGDNDILSARLYPGVVVLNENLGDGNFADDEIVSFDLDAPTQLFPLDFDNDGDTDLIITYGGGYQSVQLFENLGEGEFEPSLVLVEIIYNPTIFVEDIDADGRIDVSFPGSLGEEQGIFWCNNLGGGDFSAPALLIPYNGAGDYTFTDIDHDGDPDLFKSKGTGNSGLLAFRENQGNGLFADEVEIISDFVSVVNFGDVDNDGDRDILYAYGWREEDYNDLGHSSVGWSQNLNVVGGCTDPNACNYNVAAQADNNSCIYYTNCPDLNNDGETNITDLLDFLGQFGCIGDCSGDFNGDGVVNIVDMLILLGLL